MELIDLLPKVAEYGATGVLALALYLIARLYHPQFSALSQGLKDLPAALAALTETIGERSEQLEEGLDEVKTQLEVIKDRLPRQGEQRLAARVRERMAAGD